MVLVSGQIDETQFHLASVIAEFCGVVGDGPSNLVGGRLVHARVTGECTTTPLRFLTPFLVVHG